MELGMLKIETERLILRPYNPEDADAVFKVIGRREIYNTTLFIPHPYPRENLDWWICFTRKNIQSDYCYELGSFDKVTGDYIGNIGIFNISKQSSGGELAYFVHPDKWKLGYATEATLAMLQFAFDKLQLERILGRCMAHNIASKCVLEKCGLSFEGLARHEVKKEEKYIDVMRYAILSEDYINNRSLYEIK